MRTDVEQHAGRVCPGTNGPKLAGNPTTRRTDFPRGWPCRYGASHINCGAHADASDEHQQSDVGGVLLRAPVWVYLGGKGYLADDAFSVVLDDHVLQAACRDRPMRHPGPATAPERQVSTTSA